jgi:hypothetical protein
VFDLSIGCSARRIDTSLIECLTPTTFPGCLSTELCALSRYSTYESANSYQLKPRLQHSASNFCDQIYEAEPYRKDVIKHVRYARAKSCIVHNTSERSSAAIHEHYSA